MYSYIDRWMNLEADWKNLAPVNFLCVKHRDNGNPLTREQSIVALHFLSYGKIPSGVYIYVYTFIHMFI
jgi:hypothetical protein